MERFVRPRCPGTGNQFSNIPRDRLLDQSLAQRPDFDQFMISVKTLTAPAVLDIVALREEEMRKR